jgi:hypothetical protein
MERALYDVFTVAAKVSETPTDFSQLTDVQLAQEVQKFNGYNHFSRSAAVLLEEVVTRLVGDSRPPQGQGVPSIYTSSGPIFPGSSVTVKHLDDAIIKIRTDLHEVDYKDYYTNAILQMQKAGIEFISDHVAAIKAQYNLRSIISQNEYKWGDHTFCMYKLADGAWVWYFEPK